MQSYATESLLQSVKKIARDAGDAILRIYHTVEEQAIEYKQDGSPLTAADKIANQIIEQGLLKLTPDIPILSEEGTDIPYSERVSWERYWLVDPLDGTKEFLQRTGDFTVNIALVEKQHSTLGVVYAPVKNDCYYAARGMGAFKENAQTDIKILQTVSLPEQIRVVASRLHGNEQLSAFLGRIPNHVTMRVGSSLKFCLVAAGEADIYPRLGLTSEWDTAAAQCIVEQAGGAVIDLHGLPLLYNTRDSLLNPYFLVVGDKRHAWLEYLEMVNVN